MNGWPWQRVGAYIHRRRVLYAVVALSFVAGLVMGAIGLRGVGGHDAVVLRERMEQLWAMGPSRPSLSGERALAWPIAAAMASKAWFSSGGIAPTLGLCILLALSVIGAPLVLLLTFWRGFALGFAGAFIVYAYQWRGVLIALVAFTPHNVVTIPALVLAAGGTLDLACQAVMVLFGRRLGGVGHGAVRTGLVWLFCGGLMTAGALVEGYVTPVLLQWAADRLL